MSVGIYFGSTNGNTQHVASKLKRALGTRAADPADILNATRGQLESHTHLMLGISTWHVGELQDDWAVNWKEVKATDWAGRRVALFGCGDQDCYAHTFQDAMGELYKLLMSRGAHLYGYTNPAGYRHEASKAVVNGWFCGLALDEDNEPDQTDPRIQSWVEKLEGDFFA